MNSYLVYPVILSNIFMNRILKIIGILLFILFIIGSPALLKAQERNETNLGKQIYEEHCKVCHGDNGNGKTFVANVLKPPPKNFTNPMVIDTLSQEQMIYSVTKGRPGTGMMPWGPNLTKKKIEAVVDYIRSTFMHK